MKKHFFFLAILSINPFFQSCEAERIQSEVTIESITGTAEIRGNVNYDGGHKVNDVGTISSTFHVNAADQIVIARIPYASYVSAGAPVGNLTFRDTTDVNGNFSFTIPVGVKELTNITIEVIPFYAPHEVLLTDAGPPITYKVYTNQSAFYDKDIKTTTPIVIMESQIVKVNISTETN